MHVAFVNELQITGLYHDYKEILFILYKKSYKARESYTVLVSLISVKQNIKKNLPYCVSLSYVIN